VDELSEKILGVRPTIKPLVYFWRILQRGCQKDRGKTE